MIIPIQGRGFINLGSTTPSPINPIPLVYTRVQLRVYITVLQSGNLVWGGCTGSARACKQTLIIIVVVVIIIILIQNGSITHSNFLVIIVRILIVILAINIMVIAVILIPTSHAT